MGLEHPQFLVCVENPGTNPAQRGTTVFVIQITKQLFKNNLSIDVPDPETLIFKVTILCIIVKK